MTDLLSEIWSSSPRFVRLIFTGESLLEMKVSYKQSVRRPVLAAAFVNDGLTQYGSD